MMIAMLILAIRTDKPEAELALYEDRELLDSKKWTAHRELSEKILSQIEDLLTRQQKSWNDLKGIVCYKGPGSFTGLRIGLTVANTLANQLGIPIIGAMSEQWVENGIDALGNQENDTLVVPEYGAPVHITQQKK